MPRMVNVNLKQFYLRPRSAGRLTSLSSSSWVINGVLDSSSEACFSWRIPTLRRLLGGMLRKADEVHRKSVIIERHQIALQYSRRQYEKHASMRPILLLITSRQKKNGNFPPPDERCVNSLAQTPRRCRKIGADFSLLRRLKWRGMVGGVLGRPGL
jgi:hypothetical protein